MEFEGRRRVREARNGGLHRVHPAGELVELEHERIKLLVRGLGLLVDGRHGFGELSFRRRGPLGCQLAWPESPDLTDARNHSGRSRSAAHLLRNDRSKNFDAGKGWLLIPSVRDRLASILEYGSLVAITDAISRYKDHEDPEVPRRELGTRF